MFCTFCGRHNNNNDEICHGCGEKFIFSCLRCGTIMPHVKKARYCFHCGELFSSELKSNKKESFIKTYSEVINNIKTYVTSSNKWVSYQELSEHLGVGSYLDLINPSDKDSTVGKVIYNAGIRNNGFETISFKVKNLANTVRTVRFIKLKTLLINQPLNSEAISVIQKNYPDFNEAEVIEVSKLG